ncbi:60S ribosomal protein L7 [Rhodotorula toruloides]|nr:60S ribosomal protein L7 [Rhodotorula toruloides]
MSSQTPLVPETLLKKRKSTEKSREEKRAAALEARKVRKAKRAVIFKRAEQYVNEYNKKEREEIRLRRQAKANGDFYVPAQPKVYFVMRIKGINNIAPKPRKILQLLRLLQINNGVFVKVTKATSEMLLRVEPYITYGEPNLKTIRELVYKRGYGKVRSVFPSALPASSTSLHLSRLRNDMLVNTVDASAVGTEASVADPDFPLLPQVNRQRVPLSSNAVIEENLGKYGILSIEDIVHEIATVGPHFREVSNFLWPFKLSNPNGGSRPRKFKQFIEGGELGKREAFINDLVRKCN